MDSPLARTSASTTAGGDKLLTVDRFVPHVSTVPANLGRTVGLHLREKVLGSTLEKGAREKPPVVLFLHGGYSPSVIAYDFDYRDYSWMAQLARAGYDVFALTHTGYGASPKPMMDDPCNVDAAFQDQLIPKVLKARTPPRYPFKLISSRTEWDEIETAVDYILALRGAEKLSLVGWSTGTPRAGGYAALHPEKVDRMVLLAPAPFFPSDTPPDPMPEPGAPVILQSYDMLMKRRWENDVRADGQVEHPEVRELMWRELMFQDGLGAEWGPDGVGVMRAPNRMNFGWRANCARIHTPTLILLGEFDNYEKRRDSWKGLASTHKVFVKLRASHFAQYERGRHTVHALTEEWLRTGKTGGASAGEFSADWEGRLTGLTT
jgi:pimeloyl-ACP methyl ester carboxylesterase